MTIFNSGVPAARCGRVLALALAVLALAGCATVPPPVETAPTDDERLLSAGALVGAGQARRAVQAFADIRDHSADPAIRQRARLGMAAALRAAGDPAAAIGVLMPLPPGVNSEADARHYAMAGELYLRRNAHEAAAAYLERALAYDGGGKWRAAALFNLGKCAIALELPRKARDLFAAAAPAFAADGDDVAAQRALAIVGDLDTLLADGPRGVGR